MPARLAGSPSGTNAEPSGGGPLGQPQARLVAGAPLASLARRGPPGGAGSGAHGGGFAPCPEDSRKALSSAGSGLSAPLRSRAGFGPGGSGSSNPGTRLVGASGAGRGAGGGGPPAIGVGVVPGSLGFCGKAGRPAGGQGVRRRGDPGLPGQPRRPDGIASRRRGGRGGPRTDPEPGGSGGWPPGTPGGHALRVPLAPHLEGDPSGRAWGGSYRCSNAGGWNLIGMMA